MPSTSSLDPEFRPLAEHLLTVARDAGHRVLVASTRRSWADQNRLYQAWLAGRSPLPALPPGQSLHELGLAMDVNILGEPAIKDGVPNPNLAEMGSWWRSWGHPWSAKDPVHFQPSWARRRAPRVTKKGVRRRRAASARGRRTRRGRG
jgi:hypothetical protein